MISVHGLKKSFGDLIAISDVSFGFDKGEIVALLGGNGSGKSTSINIMTGLMIPDEGHVSVQGLDPFKNPIDAKKKLGVFPDKAGLYPNLTVREHLQFFGHLQGMTGKTLKTAIDRTVRMLEMEDIIDRRTKGFSHGQTVKTALGRAMVHGPDYLILDEPTRGLDVYAVRQLRHLLMRLRDNGTGILFSSHVMQEVSLLANRVAVIADGKVCAEETPDALIAETGADTLEDAFMIKVGLK
ncbi:ABC transporter [Kordiimonas sediminis]|uniref:ABC transporter n=1 Tax=Kordiimonas sediminis TaxID=1735581 RepID=A0A919ATB9_9PROT|nr:ATP-binding cassette domain-containing protein [Kordiimonas sediminis]GHF24564.1 ABC transporter [Kordiimonas sediminis]